VGDQDRCALGVVCHGSWTQEPRRSWTGLCWVGRGGAGARCVRPGDSAGSGPARRAGDRDLIVVTESADQVVAEASEDLDGHGIAVRLDDLLTARGMTLGELSTRVRVTVANPAHPGERQSPRDPLHHPDRDLQGPRLHPRRPAGPPWRRMIERGRKLGCPELAAAASCRRVAQGPVAFRAGGRAMGEAPRPAMNTVVTLSESTVTFWCSRVVVATLNPGERVARSSGPRESR
jgi:hypothetical protein